MLSGDSLGAINVPLKSLSSTIVAITIGFL